MRSTSRRWPARRRRRAAARLAGALACGVLLVGCTGGAGPPPEASRERPLEIELVAGVEGLGPEERQELQRQVGDVLSEYVVGAFLGDYPRDDFVDALTTFTSGAAQQAAGDLDLLTARRYRDATQVRAQRLVARVSAFPARGRAAGASADVRFRFSVVDSDGSSRSFRVSGRLALLPDDGEWRIFAYDVTRQDQPAGRGAGQ